MKLFAVIFLIFLSFSIKAQETPVKWATQESFFQDLAGKELPDFMGLTTDKRPFHRSALQNEIVVINFWFEKCPPCLAEMPELNELFNRYHLKGIHFIGITHDSPKVAKRFQKRNGYKYEIISLTADEIRKLNINHGFPSNVLVGKDGKIIFATANISFKDETFKSKSVLFEEKLKAEINKSQ